MIWFTSDTHFGHDRILEITDRDSLFSNIADHDEHLIASINSVVRPNDTLYHLGDFCWHGCDQYRARIECRNVHLIWGNHDRANFAKYFTSTNDVKMLKHKFNATTETVPAQEVKLFLSHYAHYVWPSSHRGAIHLYGHSHSEREATLDSLFPRRRSMDVGVDNAKLVLGCYRPFSMEDVLEKLLSKTGHDLVEFYDNARSTRKQNESRS